MSVFLVGPKLTFHYGTGDETLTCEILDSNGEFKPEPDGEGYLARFGYDREDDPEWAAKTQLSSRGISFWKGPSFRLPQKFQFSLQRLTTEKYFALEAMKRRQQVEKLSIILYDERLVLDEALPRTRARVGAVAEAIATPGIAYTWGIFKIEILVEEWRRKYWKDRSGIDRFDLAFAAKENLPPLPPTEDLS